jgi:hypothetical protein
MQPRRRRRRGGSGLPRAKAQQHGPAKESPGRQSNCGIKGNTMSTNLIAIVALVIAIVVAIVVFT